MSQWNGYPPPLPQMLEVVVVIRGWMKSKTKKLALKHCHQTHKEKNRQKSLIKHGI
jgi:hypothetical protein